MIDNIDPDYKLPLELSLWRHEAWLNVMKYDATQFLPFDDDELWLEPPPKKKGAAQSKQLKTPKELATAVSSSDLKHRPERLSELKVKAVKVTDTTSYLTVRARARHIPNGKNGVTLALRMEEIASDLPDPIPMLQVKFQYDLAKGTGGLCDSQGLLQARITDPQIVAELEPLLQGKGKFRVRACVEDKEGKVLGTAVAPVIADIGTSPSAVTGSLIFGKVVSKEFRDKVFSVAKALEVNPNHLMACMAFETGREFKASTKNRGGHAAYGLIQFTPVAAKDLNVELNALKAMSEVEQLHYVQLYFQDWKNRKKLPLKTLGDVYACIICPEAIGQPDTHRCYEQGGKSDAAFNANKNLARGKTYITKEDITVPVMEQYTLGHDVKYRFG